nr:hypothetical protein [Tanacetum cinerariifolium]
VYGPAACCPALDSLAPLRWLADTGATVCGAAGGAGASGAVPPLSRVSAAGLGGRSVAHRRGPRVRHTVSDLLRPAPTAAASP